MEEVNVSKSQCQAFSFHLFFNAAKSCLFPFLSLYFRYLGLDARQTGAVLGARSAVNMLFAPCWTRCSSYCGKKRFVLVFSVLVLIGSYLLLMLVPQVDSEVAKLRFCPNEYHLNSSLSGLPHEGDIDFNEDFGEKSTTSAASPATSTSITATSTSSVTTSTTANPKTAVKSTIPATTTTTTIQTTQAVIKKTTSVSQLESDLLMTTEPEEILNENQKSIDDLLEELGLTLKDLKEMDPDEIQDLIAELDKNEDNGKRHVRAKRDAGTTSATSSGSNSANTSVTNLQEDLYDSIANLMNTISGLPSKINALVKVFWYVLAIVVVGELFSAPTDKISDDLWFEFLDGADMLEKYGSHRLWGCIGFALLPPVITAVIDYMPCVLPGDIPRINLHLFSYGCLGVLALLTSLCYPVFKVTGNSKKVPRRSKCFKGLRILIGSFHPLLFTITMILLGVFQGVLSTFLFWRVQDAGGTELIMGLSVTAAFSGEFFLLLLQRCIVRKMGSAAGVLLGMFMLSLRFVLYSFLWNPWLVLAGEGLSCVSSSLVKVSVEDFADFRLNPLVMDRSAKAVLSSLYQGLGLAVGSAGSGLVYDWVGVDVLFQACAVIGALWCFLFGIIYKCTNRPQKVRYAKLLQEEENLSDGSMEYDDDWLEVAMQHHR